MFPFTYSLNICWTPTICQELDHILGIRGKTTGQVPALMPPTVQWSGLSILVYRRFFILRDWVSTSRNEPSKQGFLKCFKKSEQVLYQNAYWTFIISPFVTFLFFPLCLRILYGPLALILSYTLQIFVPFTSLSILWSSMYTSCKFTYSLNT